MFCYHSNVYYIVLFCSEFMLARAMAESCETPLQIKVLTLNCWAIPRGIPAISSPHLMQRVAKIADFIILLLV